MPATATLLVFLAACGDSDPGPGTTLAPVATPTDETFTAQRLQEGLIYRTLDSDWTVTPEVQQLIAEAQREGSVHVTTYNQDQVDAWCQAFTKRFTVECAGRGIWGAQAVATLITERHAGETITDVVHLSMSQAQQVLDRDYMAVVDWESLGVDPGRAWASQGSGNAVGATQSQYTHFYNTNVFSEADLPQTLDAWLDPKYKGQACAADFLIRAGSGFTALYLGMDATVDLVSQLIEEQDLVITATCDPLVVSEERPLVFLGYGNPPSLLEGNPVAQFWNPGLGVNLFSNMVPNDAPHPSAARLFAAWSTSREASHLSYQAIGQGWAAYGHGPEGLVSGRFADIDLVYESPSIFEKRGENTRTIEERVFGARP